MKVYLVHSEYYDYGERAFGSILLGVYSSMELATKARDEFFEKEFTLANSAQKTVDADNNPVIEIFYDGELSEDNTFTIEEWTVN